GERGGKAIPQLGLDSERAVDEVLLKEPQRGEEQLGQPCLFRGVGPDADHAGSDRLNFISEAHETTSWPCQSGQKVGGLYSRLDFRGPREFRESGYGISKIVILFHDSPGVNPALFEGSRDFGYFHKNCVVGIVVDLVVGGSRSRIAGGLISYRRRISGADPQG